MQFEADPEFEDRMAMADAIRRVSLAEGSPEMVMVPKAKYFALEARLAEAMEVLLDAAAHLAAASSAYDKFAARHKDLKPRAVADPMFTTRNSDFIKASSRVSSAARRLVEKED